MKKRILGLDIVRVIAILFVTCIHYFLNNGFYGLTLNNKSSFVLLYFRWLFFTCVPLFLLLTGYLKCNNKLDKKHYKGIISVLISYVIIEILIYFFKVYYLKENISLFRHIINIIGFHVDDYSWYVELYIGLFLLIPFLNLIYKGLENKKQKQFLIITLLILTGLPSIFSNMKLNIDIFPNWWVGIYPITYYFIGCYLREYQIKFNKLILIISVVLLLFFQTVFTFFNSYNSNLNWNFMGGYGSIVTVGISVLIFLIFYDLNINNKFILKIISLISICSFDMYLVSYIFDTIIYKKISFDVQINYFKYFYIPILVFVLSFIVSLIKKVIFDIIKKIYKRRKA